jgi:hypothetical protein
MDIKRRKATQGGQDSMERGKDSERRTNTGACAWWCGHNAVGSRHGHPGVYPYDSV